MRGRRLIVLFFDLSSMQPEELERAVKAAHDYVEHKLSDADLIAIASFSTSLQVVQDFTADAEALRDAIDGFGSNNAAGFDNGLTGDVEDTPDTGNAFTADDTEFNIFNTDRRLDALRTLADQLAGIEQKKSVIYFSSGMSQQGQDNQVQLRRTVDRANRPTCRSTRPTCADCRRWFPGATRPRAAGAERHLSPAPRPKPVRQPGGSQETLTTIAEDTGGRAFFDSNTSVRCSTASSTTHPRTTCSVTRARTRARWPLPSHPRAAETIRT
jgi:VWFA-related protein